MTDPHRFYKFQENLEISEEYSLRLYQSLRKFFPKLDFHLLVLNSSEHDRFEEKILKIGDDITIVKAPPVDVTQEESMSCYKNFFNHVKGSFEE